MQVPCCVVAVPKSIDNDLLLFDKTFGCAALRWAGRCAGPPPLHWPAVHHALLRQPVSAHEAMRGIQALTSICLTAPWLAQV